ncbi:MAG: energy transducer TonB [Kofleriaceae bacterium]
MQAAVGVIYVVTRPIPLPSLTIRLIDDGTMLGDLGENGHVLVTRVGDSAPLLRCDKPSCSIELPPNTRVTLKAVVSETGTFGGYYQYPMRTPRALQPYLGDPLASCLDGDAVLAAAAGDVTECGVTITASTDVAVEFGTIPKEAEVALNVPTPAQESDASVPKPPPTPIDPEKLEETTVAIQPPNQPPPPPIPQLQPPPPPPPPPPPQHKQEPPKQPPPDMVMVEVKDENIVDKAPDDAKALSDKNRDVKEETRAKETNLEKELDGKTVATRENDDKTSKEVGGPDDKIRQMEETDKTTDERLKPTDHSGQEQTASGEIKGDGGDNGADGKGEKDPGLLSMRDIGGRGRLVDQNKDGKKAGKKGLPGLNTPISFNDYERIMGKEKVDEERQVAARKMSSKKGRWEKKLAAVQSSLENFVPDIRPGNQTALKTRAHPFAVYVARMHRRIHELWGFGFLEDLDDKAADYPLNNPDLWVNLELSVNPDGTLHKVTIAKTSGKTEFDVAAVDTVISSGPFDPPPEAIRSVDGRIYLRWGFYRNWRQCGTFNVEPYILTEVPSDSSGGVLDDGEMVRNTGKVPGKKRPPLGDKPVTPDDGKSKERVSPKTSVTDKQAVFAANLWVSAFATAQIDKLVKYSTVPFYAGGKVAANTTAELKEMYGGLIVESGPMKDWKLLTPSEYTNGGQELPEGNLVLQIRTAKESFAVVLSKTKSGDFRATQLAR